MVILFEMSVRYNKNTKTSEIQEANSLMREAMDNISYHSQKEYAREAFLRNKSFAKKKKFREKLRYSNQGKEIPNQYLETIKECQSWCRIPTFGELSEFENSIEESLKFTAPTLGQINDVEQQAKTWINSWSWKPLNKVNTTVYFEQYMLKVTTYVGNLLLCQTVPQVIAASLQFLTSVASTTVVEWFRTKAPMPNEAASDTVSSLIAYVQNARGVSAELTDSPLYKFVMDMFGIAAVAGFQKDISIGDCIVVTSQWMKQRAEIASLDFIGTLFRSVEFTLEVLSTIFSGGSLSKFASGRGVLAAAAQLLAREQDAKSFLLEQKHGMALETHLARCRVIRIELQELLRKSNGSTFVLANATLAKMDQHISIIQGLVDVSGFRERPFCIMLAGPSAVGKSTLLQRIYKQCGEVGDFEYGPKNVAAVSETDRYDSTITGATTIIQLDDMCQCKDQSQLSEKPQEKMLRYNNTAPAMAVKADVAEKGVIPIQPRLVAITTNNETLNAETTMKAPAALLSNRINVAAWVTAADYCRNPDTGAIIQEKVIPGKPCQVIREISYKYSEGGRVTATHGPEMSVDDWLIQTLFKMKKHIIQQRELKENYVNNMTEIKMCKECCRPTDICVCVKNKDDVSSQHSYSFCSVEEEAMQMDFKLMENEIVVEVPKYYIPAVKKQPRSREGIDPPSIGSYQTEDFEQVFSWFRTKSDRSELGPRVRKMVDSVTLATIFSLNRRKLINRYEDFLSAIFTRVFWRLVSLVGSHVCIVFGLFLLLGLFLLYSNLFGGLIYVAIFFYVGHLICYRTKGIVVELVVEEMVQAASEDAERTGLNIILDNVVIIGKLVSILAIARGVIGLVRGLVSARPNLIEEKRKTSEWYMEPEGNIMAPDMCQIRARRNEVNEWLTAPKPVHLRGIEAARTGTFEAVRNTISKRVCTIRIPTNDQKSAFVVTEGIHVYSNWVILPRHTYLKADCSSPWKFIFDECKFGSNRTSLIDIESVTSIRSDHVAVRVIKLNRTGDIRKFFVDEPLTKDSLCSMLICKSNEEEGEITIPVHGRFSDKIQTAATVIAGFEGQVKIRTKNGDCGSPWIRKTAPHMIMGLHNGRAEDNVCCETIFASDLKFMEDVQVRKYSVEGDDMPVVVTASPPIVDIPTSLYGEEVLSSDGIHPNSCMHYCTMHEDRGEPLLECYGSMESFNFSTTHSKVVRSSLSEHLEAVGYPCIWGKPPMSVGRNHEEAMKVAQHPVSPIPGDVISWARADYLSALFTHIRDIGYWSKPLDDVEIYNGRKFEGINPMNMSTSCGVGLIGKKREHFEVTITTEGNIYTPYDYIVAEVKRIDELLRSGKRSCPITKTAIKDEPTKLTKDVARIFYVMPIAFLANCRKYLCPILAYFMANPIQSENWFGVKVTTEEWGQCHEALTTFGSKHIMNGDYSKYDQRFSAQLITIVGDVFASIGSYIGYEEKDVVAISSLFADLANPVYVFGGTLLSVLGLMPSGNSGTVAINGVGNGILHRCAFYTGWKSKYKTPPAIGCFRSFAIMGFVGDDSIGGISRQVPWFNMQFYQKYLAKLGMPYTGADKSAEIPKYVTMATASLCKRVFARFSARIIDAPIEVESLFKSLHMLHRIPQEDHELITALNVTQALRELARYPEEVWSLHIDNIRKAVRRAELLVVDIDRSYKSWREEIELKYFHMTPPKQSDGFDLYSERDLLFDREIFTIAE